LYFSPTNVVVTAVNTNKKNKLPGVFVFNDNYTQNKASGNQQSNPDILQQIEKLAELRDKDILTEEEFQEKKQALMARL